MSQSENVEGTKIVQAAKELNVTSVTVRRYVAEFKIETSTSKNGIKVLPEKSMDELKEVRRLKEDGMTNPQVFEEIEKQRSKNTKKVRARRVEVGVKAKAKSKVDEKTKDEKTKDAKTKDAKVKGEEEESITKKDQVHEVDKGQDQEKVEDPDKAEGPGKERDKDRDKDRERYKEKSKGRFRRKYRDREENKEDNTEENSQTESKEETNGPRRFHRTEAGDKEQEEAPYGQGKNRYRSRKNRRRGGDKQKNVIQHPLAQQVVDKMARTDVPYRERPQGYDFAPKNQEQSSQSVTQPRVSGIKTKVRGYRKAVDDTRRSTSSLKRRLERPDLPEGERRWLEQIYAYQLILHQGWRHLAEYRSNTKKQQED